MVQFSVYARPCGTADRVETQVRRLKSKIPDRGEVRGLMISDAQWGRMISFFEEKRTALILVSAVQDLVSCGCSSRYRDYLSAAGWSTYLRWCPPSKGCKRLETFILQPLSTVNLV